MDSNFLLVKSSLINSILPKFLKHAFYNSAFLVFLTLFFSFVKVSRDFFNIYFREYRFYSHHIEEKFTFFKEETHSINYKQITDIEVKKDLWDRICGVGNLIIHTGNDLDSDNDSSLIIKDIKKPDFIKEQIQERIHL